MSKELLFSDDLLLAGFSERIHPTVKKYKNIDNIDLSALKNIDSAGIAYLVQIKTHYPKLSFQHASEKLMRLAELYGVEKIFKNNG